MIRDYFAFVVRSIKQRKLRSWLTIIGIVIGVAAVVALISISGALESSVTEQFEQFGTNLMFVTSAGGDFGGMGPPTSGAKLTDDDVRVIEKISGVETVMPMWYQYAEATYRGEKKFVQVAGVPPKEMRDWLDETGMKLEAGRFIKDTDGYATNIGYMVMEEIFEKEVGVGDKIEIKDKKFKVVGVIEEMGNPQDDTALWIPLETAKDLFDSEKGDYSTIILIVKSGADLDKIAEDLEEELEDKRGQKDFQILTPEKILEQISSILATIQAVLVGIASISILVGGVGIMNTMYMAVMERTRDIGIMKAIGARNSDVLSIFLLEAGLIGFVGGLFGLILGYALAYGMAAFGMSFFVTNLTIKLDPMLILFGMGFAVVLGILSGLLPARKASKLNPVDALRYE